jgi:hypothetical protein
LKRRGGLPPELGEKRAPTRLADFIAPQEDPNEAAYWQAVYDALAPYAAGFLGR